MTGVGKMRHRLELQELGGIPDEGGGTIETWLPKALVWANIEPVDGREIVTAGRVSSAVTHTITLRHRTGVRPAQRFHLAAPANSSEPPRIFEIAAVVNINERNRWLRCYCEERDL